MAVGLHRRSPRGGFFTRGMLILFGFIFLFFAWNAWDIYQKEQEAHQKAVELTSELTDLQSRKVELSATLERFGTQDGLEGEVRETLQVAKPGEHVIVIVDPQQSASSTKAHESFWSTMVGWFGF